MKTPVQLKPILILIGLWLISLIGIQSIPLAKHEVLVLEATREMQVSGNWILPYFNEIPRLQKPPLNYWASGLISTLDPVHDDVQIWHVRLVSLLAALLMILLTYRTGTRIFGRKTGFFAAILLMCMQGFVDNAHDGRPDFLYATFSILQLFAWIDAWLAADKSRRQYGCSLLGWGAAALATLTKGPQVPISFFLGALLFLLMSSDRRRILCILRPVSGIALFCIMALPWWFLLNHQLQTLGLQIEHAQVSGTLLLNLVSWKQLVSGYYLWDLPLQMLPASLLLPLIFSRIWKCRKDCRPATRFLLAAMFSMLLVFSLGGHYRKHYMLPLLPIAALFVSRALCFFSFNLLQTRSKVAFFSLGVIGVTGCLVLLLMKGRFIQLAALLVLGICLFNLLKNQLEGPEWTRPSLSAQLLIVSVCCSAVMAGGNALLPLHRAYRTALAEEVGKRVKPQDMLFEWKCSAEVLPYYRKQKVDSFETEDAVVSFVKQHIGAHTVFAILSPCEEETLGNLFDIQPLYLSVAEKKSRDLVLVEILCIKNLSTESPEVSIL